MGNFTLNGNGQYFGSVLDVLSGAFCIATEDERLASKSDQLCTRRVEMGRAEDFWDFET